MSNTATLGSLCQSERSICYGIVQPGKPTASGVPIVRVNNFDNNRLSIDSPLYVAPEIEAKFRRSRVRENDLLISLVGSIGQVAIAPAEIEGWNLARAVGLVPLADKHHSRWAYFALQTPAAQRYMHEHANTTVQTTFNLKDLAALPIPYPDREIREASLEILSALDDKIEANRRTNETLEAMARAVFRDWFVDFGPTRRQLAGASDPHAILGGLIEDANEAHRLAPLFPALLGDNGLPEGWGEGTLGDYATDIRDTVLPESIDTETPYIGLEHMPRRSVALTDWEPAAKVTSNKSRFQQGQILFGKLRPYFHKTGIAPLNGICSTDIVVIDAKRERYRAFIAACVSTDEFVAFTDQTSTGTKMPRTKWGTMKTFELPKAPSALLEAYSEFSAPLFEKIIASIHENRTLAATRDLLLPKLMSGDIRLKDAEVIV